MNTVYITYCFYIHVFSFFTGIQDESRKLYGVQFHPEVDLTENGIAMIKNFIYGVSIKCAVLTNQ